MSLKTKSKSNRENPYYIAKFNSEKSKNKRTKREILNFSPVEEKFFKRSEEIGMPLIRQYPVSRYKIDFVYIHKDQDGNDKFKIAIEIDGSKFHTTTEQLNSDYKRERHLLLQGFMVVRFTGSEVHNHCGRCLDEVIQIINYLNGSEAFKKSPIKSSLIEKVNEESLQIVVRKDIN